MNGQGGTDDPSSRPPRCPREPSEQRGRRAYAARERTVRQLAAVRTVGGVPRVASALVGDFGAIVRLGLVGVLADAAIDCVDEARADGWAVPGGLLERLDRSAPDVVVVDWDDRRYEAVAASVLARRPAVTVIACSDERLAMRVVPGRRDRGVYESRLSAQGLVEAVRAASTADGPIGADGPLGQVGQ